MIEGTRLLDIARLRLINQQLAGTTLRTAQEMTAWLGAVQGQEYAQSKWALGLRLPHLRDSDIEAAFAAGQVLRTHILRPTWHLVAAGDIRWLLSLSGPRVDAVNAHRYRQLDLDAHILARCNDIIADVLQGGGQLDRKEIGNELVARGISTEGQRLSHILMYAELNGVICSGPRRGKRFTYMLLDERVPPAAPVTRDEALAKLAERYFISRGPAGVRDFSNWSGLTMADCRRGLEMVRDRLIEEAVNGDRLYRASDATLAEGRRFEDIYLLPVYDELLMSYRDRSVFMQYSPRAGMPAEWRYDSAIVYDGQIIGTWRRLVRPKGIDMEYDFFVPPNERQRFAFKRAVERFKDFVGLDVNDLTGAI